MRCLYVRFTALELRLNRVVWPDSCMQEREAGIAVHALLLSYHL